MGNSITPRQQHFVEEYLVDLNAADAARRAGYSPHTAKVQASRLLDNTRVLQAIQEAMEGRSRRLQKTADDVLMELWSVVERNERENDAVVLRALELIGKHLGMFTERHHVVQEIRKLSFDLSNQETLDAALALVRAQERAALTAGIDGN